MTDRHIIGQAQDIEAIVRLRPWIEDVWREKYGDFLHSKLITDYDAKSEIFKFKIEFSK